MRLKRGDLIWMECLPGGLCVFLDEGDDAWDHYYQIYHATEGIQKMPDYYFIDVDEAKQLGYI